MKITRQPTGQFSPPAQITIKSDGNELIFKSKSKDMYTYLYIKSKQKLGTTLTISEEHLIKLLKNNQ